jgi:hypothetical protein
MKNLKALTTITLLSITLISCIAFAPKKKHKVTGLVTQTRSQCGGMRSAKGDDRSPKPLANKKLIVRKGNSNSQKSKIVAEITTNEEGKFELDLPAGTYSFVGEEKTKFVLPANDKFNTYDADCLKKEFAKSDGLLTVKDGENKVEINFHSHCFYKKPCLTYTGPLPQ